MMKGIVSRVMHACAAKLIVANGSVLCMDKRPQPVTCCCCVTFIRPGNDNSQFHLAVTKLSCGQVATFQFWLFAILGS